MSDEQTVESCFDYFQRLRKAIAHDRTHLPRHREVSEGLNSLEQRLQRLSGDIAFHIALIGVANAGKSSVICALLGNDSIVPINHTPTTGNMIVISVRQGADHLPPTVGQYELYFFTEETAVQAVQFMIRTLTDQLHRDSHRGDRIGEHSVPDALMDEATRLGTQAADPSFWTSTMAWVNHMTPVIHTLLKLRLTEIQRMASTWIRHGHLVAGKRIPVSRDVAHRAMCLQPEQMSPIRSGQIRDINTLTVNDIDECYDLIREVRIHLTLPVNVWDLSSLPADSLELVDFPGFGADTSCGRDWFLIDSERSRIHTWVSIASGEDTRGFGTSSFLGNADAKRLIYVVNKFDALRMTNDERSWLQDAAGGAGGLSTQSLLENNQSLNKWGNDLKKAMEFGYSTAAARTSLISAALATAGGRHQIDGAATEVMKAWRSIASRLEGTTESNVFKRWLTDVSASGDPGGINALRRMLVTLAKADGVRQIAIEADSLRRDLKQNVRQWLRLFDSQVLTDESPVSRIRRVLQSISGVLNRFRLPASLDDVCVSGQAIDLISIGHALHHETVSRNLSVFTRRLAQQAVWNWPCWKNLIKLARSRSGYVTLPEPTTRARRGPLAMVTTEEQEFLPAKASELTDAYSAEWTGIALLARKAMMDAIAELVTALQNVLMEIPANSSVQKELNALLKPNSVMHMVLSRAGVLTEQLLVPWLDLEPPDGLSGFPFRCRRDDERRVIVDSHFGWARERVNGHTEPHQHQLYVMRLRQELTDGIIEAAMRDLSSLLTAVRREWASTLSDIERDLHRCQCLTDHQIAAMTGCAVTDHPRHRLQLSSLA